MTDLDQALTGSDDMVTVVVAVGEPAGGVDGAAGVGGWSWGWSGRERQYLTIAGSAYRRPRFGATPGTAYRYGPDGPHGPDVCARVVPVWHAGVTGSGIAYRIVQLAERVDLELLSALLYEDQEQDGGVLPGHARLTCRVCRTWNTGDHLSTAGHAEQMMAATVTALGIEQ